MVGPTQPPTKPDLEIEDDGLHLSEEGQSLVGGGNDYSSPRRHGSRSLLGVGGGVLVGQLLSYCYCCGISRNRGASLVVALVLIVATTYHLGHGRGRYEDLKEKDRNEEVPSIKQQQILNYIKGDAIIRNVHITHHAGTSLCSQMSKVGHTPGFACMGKGKNNDTYWPEDAIKESPFDGKYGVVGLGVSYNETKEWVTFWRQYYHYATQEYRFWDKYLHQTNWEYEKLVSVIVMRDPLDRFLAGGKCGSFQVSLQEDPSNQTQDLYWEYANSDCADNYALQVLTKEPCVEGANTTVSCLESAKDFLNRFTFILDQSCLAESVVAMGNALHLNFTETGFESNLHKKHQSARERFGNDTLYEYVQTRFQRDIELYEWSKKRSIVVCKK